MGAWGSGILENDAADEWLGMALVSNVDFVQSAIASVIGNPNYLDADDASCALVACDLLAILAGSGMSSPYPPEIADWISTLTLADPRGALADGVRAIRRILTEPSELLELWEDVPEWFSNVNHIETTLIRLMDRT